MGKAALAAIATGAAVLALAGAALSTSKDVWKSLRRPLQIPHLAPGAQCPASAPDAEFDFAAHGVGQGYGPGPAYPIFPKNPPVGALDFDYPPSPESTFSGSKWSGQKVLWFFAQDHGVRVLVRGRQLDGPYGVRFGLAPTPSRELKIAGSGAHPATTRLRTGGCYGYQIDGPDYSRVIVFEAKLRCLAAPVVDSRVRAGPFTGQVNGPNYVVGGRFRLHVGGRNKMGWDLPRKRAKEAPWLSVKGVRLAPPRRVFTDSLAEIFGAGFPEDQHVYASNLKPPTAGCWRLTFKTGRLKGSLVVLVSDG
jgi:hypothetical protein